MAEKKSKKAHPRDFEQMDDKEILQQVVTDIDISTKFQRPYFDKFIEDYKQFKGHIDEKNRRPHGANLFIPYTFQLVETIVPKIVLSMFSTRPYVQTMPLGVDDSQRNERSKKMNKLLDYQFHQKIKLVPYTANVIKYVCMFGTAVTMQTWKFKTKKIVKKRPKKILGFQLPNTYDEVLVESVVNDEPASKLIPITDFFFDPTSTEIEDMRYCAYRDYVDLDELKSRAQNDENYKNLDKITDKDEGYPVSDGYDMLSKIGMSSGNTRKRGIELIEYWTDDWVVRVANGNVVVYSGENPYHHRSKPFAKWVSDPIPSEFYGTSAPESIRHLQEELNATRNQRIDNVSLILNKMYKILRGADVDTEQLVSRPGGYIEVDDMKDIEELKFTDVTSSAYQEEGIIKRDMDMTTGVHDSARGSESSRRETATTMSILANAGTERFKLKTTLLENGGFFEMVNQIMRLNQQFIDRDTEVQILGNDGSMETVMVTPDEILGEYDIVAIGSSVEPVINKEIRQNQLIQLYGIVKENQMINQQALIRRIFESFDMKNIDELLTLEQPQQQPPEPQMVPPEGMMGGMEGQLPMDMMGSPEMMPQEEGGVY